MTKREAKCEAYSIAVSLLANALGEGLPDHIKRHGIEIELALHEIKDEMERKADPMPRRAPRTYITKPKRGKKG